MLYGQWTIVQPGTIPQCTSPFANLNFTLLGRTSPSGPSGTCFLKTGGCFFSEDFLGGRGTGCVTRMCRTGLKGISSVSLGGGGSAGVVRLRPRREERRAEVRWSMEPARRPTRAADASCRPVVSFLGVVSGVPLGCRGRVLVIIRWWRLGVVAEVVKGVRWSGGTYKRVKRLRKSVSNAPNKRDLAYAKPRGVPRPDARMKSHTHLELENKG